MIETVSAYMDVERPAPRRRSETVMPCWVLLQRRYCETGCAAPNSTRRHRRSNPQHICYPLSSWLRPLRKPWHDHSTRPLGILVLMSIVILVGVAGALTSSAHS